jgi:hypothetical protein
MQHLFAEKRCAASAMEIHPRRPAASALIDAANDGLLLASSLTGASESLVAVFRSLMVVHRIIGPQAAGVGHCSRLTNSSSVRRFRWPHDLLR